MRETLRLHSFGNGGILRQVMVDNLVTEDGFQLPQGAQISYLGYPSQTDSDVYENGEAFDPLHFCRPRELKEPDTSTVNTTFVSTGSKYWAFGHGKHACPRRFILDFELKMMLSRILRDYD
ncbi:cytochrome P450 [Amylocarpus encephaloides]|uniref:Cytochrome P450 n=1 Tax=Amylocarpus encephaloides TaxID=45428 RepID=A0A9P8C2P9_9HELO|nr:cytochrome P450 [Amylocarpus encephaloides]